MECCSSVILAIIAVIVAILYYCSNSDYFKKHGVPCTQTIPFLGGAWKVLLQRETMADMSQEAYNIEPKAKYIGTFEFMTPVIIIRDPELVKSITVKNFDHFPNHRSLDQDVVPLFSKNLFALKDDRWREVRTLLSPAFTASKMKAMFKLMVECAVQYQDYFYNLPEEDSIVEVKDVFTRYTNDVIGTCAYGIKIDSMKDRDNVFYVYGREATVFGVGRAIKFFLYRGCPALAKFLGLEIVKEEIVNFFNDIVANTIKTRDEQGIHRPDMLQLMMETRGKLGPGKELTIEEMTAQAFVFFFGGFESTSTLMCFAAHEIAVNPEVHEKLQKEVDEVLKATGGEPTYEAINGMKYLDAVLTEALRMYPVIVFTDRICEKSFELPPALPGLKPFVVEPGFSINIPIYAIQRDPQYFENPNKFNPDRFLNDTAKSTANTFLAFGLGPRMCIGNRFALLETKVLLFHILSRCNIKPCAKTSNPIKLSKSKLAMTAEDGFWLKFEKRNNPPVLPTSVVH